MKKRILSMLLVFVMLLSVVPVQALAEETATEGSAVAASSATLEVIQKKGKTSVKVGGNVNLNAQMSDGSAVDTVDWSASDDTLVKLVSNAKGVCKVYGLSAGDVIITAKANGQSQTFAMKVTGTAAATTATTATTAATAETTAPAPTETTAPAETSASQTFGLPKSGSSDTAATYVTSGICGNKTAFVGETLRLTFKITPLAKACWDATSETVAKDKITVDNKGYSLADAGYVCEITSQEAGEIKVSFAGKGALLGTPWDGSCTLTFLDKEDFAIDAGEQTVYTGKTLQLSANDGDKALTGVEWTSADPSKATVDASTGLLTAVSAGDDGADVTVEITATCDGYNDQKVTITVKQNAITIRNADGSVIGEKPSIPAEGTLELAAYDAEGVLVSDVAWSSADANVATVDPSTGVVTGVVDGNVTITAKKDGYKPGSLELTVETLSAFNNVKFKDDGTDRSRTLAVNETRELVAMSGGKPVDGVTWTIKSGTAAVLTEDGLGLKGVSEGTVKVTAEKAGFTSKTVTITVENVPVSSIDVTGYPTSMFVGDELDLSKLSITFVPGYASDKTITWETNKPNVAKVENGKLCTLKAGKVILTARFSDGSTQAMPTLTVKPTTEITLDSKLPTTLLAGETLKLNDYTKVVDARTGAVLTNAVNWELVGEEEGVTFANNVLSSRDDLTLSHVVTLKATAEGCDAVTVQKTITIYPRTSSVVLKVGTENVSGKTYALNLLDDAKAAAGVTIQASVLPANAQQDVHWVVTGDVSICTKTEAGNTLKLIPTATKKTGDITVKAVALDGTDKSATVTISFVNQGMAAEIDAPAKIRGGASVTLKANIENDGVLTDSTVTWSFADGSNTIKVDGKKVATINKTSGKLTTKTVTAKTTVRVKATIAATGKTFEKDIDIYPATKSITINGVNQKTIAYNKGNRTLNLSATVLPADAAAANWDLEWSSSDESVATVDANGVVTLKDAGTVRITCQTTDGSKVKGYLYLEITKSAKSVTISAPAKSLIAGDSMDLSAVVYSSKNVEAANQDVIWSIEDAYGDETSAATISTTGRVMAKDVDQNTTVVVVATSVEDEDTFGTYELTIVPAAEKSLRVKADDLLVSGTYTMNYDASCLLEGVWLKGTKEQTAENCTFSSSHPDVAYVDEDGILTALKYGTSTITVQCTDPATGNIFGTTFQVEVTSVVKMVLVSTPTDRYLRSGESVQLYASAWTDYETRAENQEFEWEAYEVVTENGKETLKETKNVYVNENGLLTAGTVKDKCTVRVKAISKENNISATTENIYICPANECELIFVMGGTEYADIMTVDVNTNLNYSRRDNPDGLRVYALLAIEDEDRDDGYIDVSKREVTSAVYWDSSDEDVIAVGTSGQGLTVKEIGATKLYAYYADETLGVKAVEGIIVYVENTVGSITIEQTGLLVTGGSTTMRAIPKNDDATNQNVLWSVEGDNADKVTINTYTGLLKAKSGITSRTTVTVRAKPVDGSAGEGKTQDVIIYPKTTKVDIKSGSTVVTGTTVTLTLSSKTATFTAVATPTDAYQGEEAFKAFKWSSTDEYVAEVDPDTGVVTFNATGTVTIKATAQDGTGKVGKVKLRITN